MAGDVLLPANGTTADIVSVMREHLASPVDVYNVEVADFHTYFVASAGMWVHNCGDEVVTNGHHMIPREAPGARHERREEHLGHT
jgi:Pretoxin HINT domain